MPLEDWSATLADRVYEQIVDAIVRGEFAPGSRLIETQLAARYGVSRGPLREAMRRMGERGLVIRPARQGARVVELSQKVLLDIAQVRETLESAACRLAAQNMSSEEIAHLRSLVDADERLLAGGHAYYRKETDLDIHFCIVQGAHNDIMASLLCEQLYPLIRMYRYRHERVQGRASEALREHRAIVDAIGARDGELAELLMRRHIATSRKLLLETISTSSEEQQ